MEYFEIFLGRMQLCRHAAEMLDARFRLIDQRGGAGVKRTRGFGLSIGMVAAARRGVPDRVRHRGAAALAGPRPGGRRLGDPARRPTARPDDVMEQALENIRNRVDAFGVGEPDIVLSGNTIEVQIPGLAKGTIEQRPKDPVLPDRTPTDVNYGCARRPGRRADRARRPRRSTSQASSLRRGRGRHPARVLRSERSHCFQRPITVPRDGRDPRRRPAPRRRRADADRHGRVLPHGRDRRAVRMFPTRRRPRRRDGLTVEVTERTYCVTDGAIDTEEASTPSQRPSTSRRRRPAVGSPRPARPQRRAWPRSAARTTLPCELRDREPTRRTRSTRSRCSRSTTQYCVVSSADKNLGLLPRPRRRPSGACSDDRPAAPARA